MTRTFNLQKGYRCPECNADVEAASGPDFITVWRCRNCDWDSIQDTDDPDRPEEVVRDEYYWEMRQKEKNKDRDWIHGQRGGRGSRRYCRGCEKFVGRSEFENTHRDHWEIDE